MNDTLIDEIIQSCVQAIESGELTPAECLARYPQYHQELSRHLTAVGGSAATQPTEPTAQPNRIARPGRRHISPRSWIVTTLVLLLLVTSVIGVARAADGSLPGDRLYPVKAATEDLRLALAVRQETKIKLNLLFAQQRVAEIKALIEHERPEFIQIAVGRYEQHVKQAALTLTQIPAQDRQHLADLADLVTNIISCECRCLTDLLPQVAIAYQPTIDSAVAVSQSNFELLMTVFAAGLDTDSSNPTTVPAGSTPRSTPATAVREGTATVKPTSRPVGNISTSPATGHTATPPTAPSNSPTSAPLQSSSATSTSAPAAAATPTTTATPVTTAAPARETRTATATPAALPTSTPVPTATNTVAPTATNTPIPPSTSTPPPGMTKTIEPPRLTKTPQPPGPTRTPSNH